MNLFLSWPWAIKAIKKAHYFASSLILTKKLAKRQEVVNKEVSRELKFTRERNK